MLELLADLQVSFPYRNSWAAVTLVQTTLDLKNNQGADTLVVTRLKQSETSIFQSNNERGNLANVYIVTKPRKKSVEYTILIHVYELVDSKHLV